MCGIAAVVETTGGSPDAGMLKRMMDSLVHRGPDDEGMHLDGAVGLGFRRLAIIDVSLDSHQPMVSDDQGLVIVFNGEIYNYLELRQELGGYGHVFRTHGDTEVLLHAYQQWGKDCLSRLNGMWAFLIYDRRRRIVFGARDRFGVKPLYYFKASQRILFASEIKGILASRMYGSDANIHWPTASQFLLSWELDSSPYTFYEGIEQVPAGSMFELQMGGELKFQRYWSLSDIETPPANDPYRTYVELFEDAVRLRMRSDVPVGVCLSGGLDSSSIICEMARVSSSKVEAFSYMAEEFDESLYIKDTVAQTGSVLNLVDLSRLNLWSTLTDVLKFHDEPVHSINVVIGFELMRLASLKGVKVVLNGQGADETAAGYSSYFNEYWASLIRQARLMAAWREMSAYAAAHHVPKTRLYKEAGLRAIATMVASWSLYRLAKDRIAPKRAAVSEWFDAAFMTAYQPVRERLAPQSLSEVLRYAVEHSPLPLYLRVEDRNSMGNSVESRLPFMDYRLVSFLFSMPDEYKLRGEWNKYIQRRALIGKIPESVRMRVDKMGFPVPLKKWMAGEVLESVADALHSRSCRERGIYNWPVLSNAIDKHCRGEVDASLPLFYVGQFEVWAQMIHL
jgi:asparagine synthase (glutamine-hydrolysing)